MKKSYELQGMSGGGCVNSLKEGLLQNPAVTEADVQLSPLGVVEAIFNDRLIQPMKRIFLLLASFLLMCTFTLAQEKGILFDVMFKDEKVGVMHTQETKSKSTSLKVLTIETSTTFLFIPIHVESEVSTTQKGGVLIKGTAYRNASRKSSDVIASVTKIGTRLYQRERNGVTDKIKNLHITFCVIDLYFKEPVGITRVFSNMYAEMLQLKQVSVGKYQLITPDNNNSIYTYRNGELISIEVETPVGKVISKRI
jgi:copper chaperone CopZ